MGRNIEQKRAGFALAQVEKLVRDGKVGADEIKNAACKIIALILNSGFLQAMNFAKAKAKSGNLGVAYNPLEKWFAAKDEDGGPGFSDEVRQAAAKGSLDVALDTMSKHEYRRGMQEAIAFLGWLKSKAEGKEMELALDQQAEEQGGINT